MRYAVHKAEKFYITIEVADFIFDASLDNFEKVFDDELERACNELRQTAKARFNEIKQSAEGATREGGSNPRISDC